MTEILIGLAGGITLGLSAAPLWMMLQLPVRILDMARGKNIRMLALALAVGAVLGSLHLHGFLWPLFGIIAMLMGGVFVGMLSSALIEAVEVVPILFDRLSITADMRFAAAALAIGKMLGAILAGILEV